MIVAESLQTCFLKRYARIPYGQGFPSLTDIEPLNYQRLVGASLLVFANKTDVEGCMTEEEIRMVRAFFFFFAIHYRMCISECLFVHIIVSLQRLALDLIKTHKWTIMPCSAMTGRNLDRGLEWVVNDAKDRLFLY